MKRLERPLMAAALIVLVAGTATAQDNPGPKANRPTRGTPGALDADALFTRFDRNGDGVLTKDEFPHAERFDTMDADKDGKITREELKTAVGNGLMRLGERAGQQMVAARLKQLDTDGDGKVSKAEFDAAFARLDKDGDGFLSEDELKAAFAGERETREKGKPDRKEGKRTESPPAEAGQKG